VDREPQSPYCPLKKPFRRVYGIAKSFPGGVEKDSRFMAPRPQCLKLISHSRVLEYRLVSVLGESTFLVRLLL
jgi:hypothetical protein